MLTSRTQSAVFFPDDDKGGLVEGSLSYGGLHNVLIDKIRESDKVYLDKDGKVLIEELYLDMAKIADSLGYKDDSSREVKQKMMSYCSSAMDICEQTIVRGQSSIVYMDRLTDYVVSTYRIPKETMRENVALVTKVSLAIQQLPSDSVPSYEEDYIKLVNKSSLSFEEKDRAQLIGGIAINSAEYWRQND